MLYIYIYILSLFRHTYISHYLLFFISSNFFYFSDWWLEFADDICELFWTLHGKDAMPCESHEMTIGKEAEGMGAKVVTVSFPLKKTLEGSPKCPTMAAYRSDFYDAMLKIPDVELDMNDKTHKRIAKIKDGVVKFFTEVKTEEKFFYFFFV